MIVNSSGVDWGVGGVMVGCRYYVGRSGLLDMFYTALPKDTLQTKTVNPDEFIKNVTCLPYLKMY